MGTGKFAISTGAFSKMEFKEDRKRHESSRVKWKAIATSLIGIPRLSCALVHGYAKAEILLKNLAISLGLIGTEVFGCLPH